MMFLLVSFFIVLGNAVVFIGGFLAVRDAHRLSERIPAAILYSIFVAFMVSLDVSFIRGISLA